MCMRSFRKILFPVAVSAASFHFVTRRIESEKEETWRHQLMSWNERSIAPIDKSSHEFSAYVERRERFFAAYPPKIRLLSLKDLKNHKWVRENHPDDERNHKYRLTVEGLEEILKRHAPGFDESNCLIWFDYSCIDQNDCPTCEMQDLNSIMKYTDVMFTPHDASADRPLSSSTFRNNARLYRDYESWSWNGDKKNGVLLRPWIRLEMQYGSNVPVAPVDESKRNKLSEWLQIVHDLERRPHFLKTADDLPLYCLPPVVGDLAKSLDPLCPDVQENYTAKNDQKKIQKLMSKLQNNPISAPAYSSGWNAFGWRSFDGYRRLVDLIGNVYEGDWKNGKKHGKGKIVYVTGDVYEGDFEENKMHGYGKITSASGAVYEGEWKQGIKEGRGKYLFETGSVYEGDWKDGFMHGQGTFTYRYGSKYEGEWYVGKMHGKGKYAFPKDFDYPLSSGVLYEGEWKDGREHGQFKMTHENGESFSVLYSEGVELSRTKLS